MGFIFFLIAAGIIFWLVIQSRNNVRNEWSQAASRLGLNYSGGGLVNPHWIYGRKAGLRYDVKTFNRSSSGATNQKWTGYRVRFQKSADVRIRITEAARTQLTNRFQECEIDDQGIFCARPGIESDAPAIIDNVERLQSVTARLMAAADAEDAEKEAAGPHSTSPPPPLPKATPEPEPDIVGTESVEAVSVTEAVDESSPLEEPAEAATAGRSEIEIEPVVESDENAPDEDPETAPPEDAEPLMTLAAVSGDLFDSGRNRFQITQRFDAEYSGLSMLGEGKLVRAEPYSNDRVFGRGPGTLAEVEIHEPGEPLPGHNTIRAVVALPEDVSARSLRENLGNTVTIGGSMLRCDAFEGKIFLGTGEIA